MVSVAYGKNGIESGSKIYGLGGVESGSVVYTPDSGSDSGDVVAAGGTVKDGEAFSVYYAPGGLTGSTTVKINNVSCTSVVVVDDFNMTAVAPGDDLLHGVSYAMEIL